MPEIDRQSRGRRKQRSAMQTAVRLMSTDDEESDNIFMPRTPARKTKATTLYCAALSCKNNQNTRNSDGRLYKFHPIPYGSDSVTAEKRRLWLKALRPRDPKYDPYEGAIVCEVHFAEPSPGPDEIPTLCLTQDSDDFRNHRSRSERNKDVALDEDTIFKVPTSEKKKKPRIINSTDSARKRRNSEASEPESEGPVMVSSKGPRRNGRKSGPTLGMEPRVKLEVFDPSDSAPINTTPETSAEPSNQPQQPSPSRTSQEEAQPPPPPMETVITTPLKTSNLPEPSTAAEAASQIAKKSAELRMLELRLTEPPKDQKKLRSAEFNTIRANLTFKAEKLKAEIRELEQKKAAFGSPISNIPNMVSAAFPPYPASDPRETTTESVFSSSIISGHVAPFDGGFTPNSGSPYTSFPVTVTTNPMTPYMSVISAAPTAMPHTPQRPPPRFPGGIQQQDRFIASQILNGSRNQSQSSTQPSFSNPPSESIFGQTVNLKREPGAPAPENGVASSINPPTTTEGPNPPPNHPINDSIANLSARNFRISARELLKHPEAIRGSKKPPSPEKTKIRTRSSRNPEIEAPRELPTKTPRKGRNSEDVAGKKRLRNTKEDEIICETPKPKVAEIPKPKPSAEAVRNSTEATELEEELAVIGKPQPAKQPTGTTPKPPPAASAFSDRLVPAFFDPVTKKFYAPIDEAAALTSSVPPTPPAQKSPPEPNVGKKKGRKSRDYIEESSPEDEEVPERRRKSPGGRSLRRRIGQESPESPKRGSRIDRERPASPLSPDRNRYRSRSPRRHRYYDDHEDIDPRRNRDFMRSPESLSRRRLGSSLGPDRGRPWGRSRPLSPEGPLSPDFRNGPIYGSDHYRPDRIPYGDSLFERMERSRSMMGSRGPLRDERAAFPGPREPPIYCAMCSELHRGDTSKMDPFFESKMEEIKSHAGIHASQNGRPPTEVMIKCFPEVAPRRRHNPSRTEPPTSLDRIPAPAAQRPERFLSQERNTARPFIEEVDEDESPRGLGSKRGRPRKNPDDLTPSRYQLRVLRRADGSEDVVPSRRPEDRLRNTIGTGRPPSPQATVPPKKPSIDDLFDLRRPEGEPPRKRKSAALDEDGADGATVNLREYRDKLNPRMMRSPRDPIHPPDPMNSEPPRSQSRQSAAFKRPNTPASRNSPRPGPPRTEEDRGPARRGSLESGNPLRVTVPQGQTKVIPISEVKKMLGSKKAPQKHKKQHDDEDIQVVADSAEDPNFKKTPISMSGKKPPSNQTARRFNAVVRSLVTTLKADASNVAYCSMSGCDRCFSTDASEFDLQRHIFQHFPQKIIECAICGENLSFQLRHFRNYHPQVEKPLFNDHRVEHEEALLELFYKCFPDYLKSPTASNSVQKRAKPSNSPQAQKKKKRTLEESQRMDSTLMPPPPSPMGPPHRIVGNLEKTVVTKANEDEEVVVDEDGESDRRKDKEPIKDSQSSTVSKPGISSAEKPANADTEPVEKTAVNSSNPSSKDTELANQRPSIPPNQEHEPGSIQKRDAVEAEKVQPKKIILPAPPPPQILFKGQISSFPKPGLFPPKAPQRPMPAFPPMAPPPGPPPKPIGKIPPFPPPPPSKLPLPPAAPSAPVPSSPAPERTRGDEKAGPTQKEKPESGEKSCDQKRKQYEETISESRSYSEKMKLDNASRKSELEKELASNIPKLFVKEVQEISCEGSIDLICQKCKESIPSRLDGVQDHVLQHMDAAKTPIFQCMKCPNFQSVSCREWINHLESPLHKIYELRKMRLDNRQKYEKAMIDTFYSCFAEDEKLGEISRNFASDF